MIFGWRADACERRKKVAMAMLLSVVVEGGKKNVSAALRNTIPSPGPEWLTVTDAERRAASFDAARRDRNLLVDRDGR
jgi:hypothetical protein